MFWRVRTAVSAKITAKNAFGLFLTTFPPTAFFDFDGTVVVRTSEIFG